MHLNLKTAAELLALRSLDSLVVGAGVWLFASVMLRMVPRQNAASRFAVWFSALLAIATIPMFSGIWSPAAGLVSSSREQAAIMVDGRWAMYVLAAWAVVSGLFLFQVARSLWQLHALRRSCLAFDPATLGPLLEETLRKHGEHRRVRLCRSNQVRVPAAIGLWRPAVVVPEWAIRELSPDELNQVVLHELAHLSRWDDWTNLAQQLVKALFFFHPAVWWIENKAALEREMACDDAVLAETNRPRAYAECLARLAERSFAHRSLRLAQAALGKVRQISTRVAQILDANRPTPPRAVWLPAACLLAVFAIGCGAWYSRAPRLVGFEEHVSPLPRMLVATASKPVLVETSAPRKPSQESLTQTATRRRAPNGPSVISARAKMPAPQTKSLVHFTGAQSSAVPVSETVWIVVERNESAANRQIFQIQMWRVTILEAQANGAHIPRKI